MRIDNTALIAFQSCPALYFLRFKQHWTPRRKSAALGFGGAVHLGLAAWYETGDVQAAFTAIASGWTEGPVDDYRTLEMALKVMQKYVNQYPREQFDFVPGPSGPLVEVVFTLPLTDGDGNQLTLDDGEPIEYGGIFDGLIKPPVYVFEHKTTSRLGPTYMYQFKPNNQVSGYIWAASVLSGERCRGALINAICTTSSGKVDFRREITTRSDYDLDLWAKDVQTTCNQIRECERTGKWPRYTKSCTMYGRCEFHDVHVKGDADTEQRILEQDYEKREWSHESRDEVTTSDA